MAGERARLTDDKFPIPVSQPRRVFPDSSLSRRGNTKRRFRGRRTSSPLGIYRGELEETQRGKKEHVGGEGRKSVGRISGWSGIRKGRKGKRGIEEAEEEAEKTRERKRAGRGAKGWEGERGYGRTFVKYTSVLKFRLETERDGTRSLWKDKIAWRLEGLGATRCFEYDPSSVSSPPRSVWLPRCV